MKRRRLFWVVFPYYLAIIAASLLIVAAYAAHEMRSLYFDEMTRSLEQRARLVTSQLTFRQTTDPSLSIDSLCDQLGQMIQTRITIVDTAGRVLGDSYEDPRTMENHRNRPEIAQALSGRVDAESRYSRTLREEMLYVAVPWSQGGALIGVVRTAVPITSLSENLSSMYRKMALIGIIIGLLAAALSVMILGRVTKPLKRLQAGAFRFAHGILDEKLPPTQVEEITAVTEAMNEMAAQLDARIRTAVRQSREREVILSSMTEGVLALDRDERVVELNRAAADLLGVTVAQASGKPLHDIIRNTQLYRLVERALRGESPEELEITLTGDSRKFLQVHVSALQDETGQGAGLLLVFNDITRIKRLETIRRDFVANVSHELRTPITAITGSIETLLDTPNASASDIRKFLDITLKHAERLNRIVEDLLALARLESQAEDQAIELHRGRIHDVLKAAVNACRHKWEPKDIPISVSCDLQLEGDINPVHLEHAVINLIDNAVKYSDPGSPVVIDATQGENEIVISVRDQGWGIEERHLPRLFERFYRVDSARSRDLGGTGLGLAIVKHIALAHGGRVTVESAPGAGSVFRIHLPLR